jgi:hypothetical protein
MVSKLYCSGFASFLGLNGFGMHTSVVAEIIHLLPHPSTTHVCTHSHPCIKISSMLPLTILQQMSLITTPVLPSIAFLFDSFLVCCRTSLSYRPSQLYHEPAFFPTCTMHSKTHTTSRSSHGTQRKFHAKTDFFPNKSGQTDDLIL